MRNSLDGKRTRLFLETLEDRTVPTTATFVNGTLTITGTGYGEQINVGQSSGLINVSGVSQTFNAAQVNRLVIDAGDGDDTVSIASSIAKPVWIYAGGGNDQVTAGGGAATIYGSGGNDVITGGAGVDVIYGGAGTNTINGQAGDQITQGQPYQSAGLSTVASQILQLVNQQRAANGLAPMSASAQLTAGAQMHSNNMASMAPVVGYSAAMAHTLSGVTAPSMINRANAVGYLYVYLGENIAYGYSDAQAVMNAWMNSSGHRANILNANYTQIGIGVAYTAQGIPYFTQFFGKPAADNPTGPGQVTTVSSGTTAPPVTNTQPPPTNTTTNSTNTTTTTSQAPPQQTTQTTQTTQQTTQQTRPIATTSGFAGGTAVTGQITANSDGAGSVRVYDLATGAMRFQVQPYAGFKGEIRVAVADLTGDGKQDVVVAPATGYAPVVKVYDGVTGAEVRSFFAFSTSWTRGNFVAAGDVNGDGRADIVVGSDAGSAGLVRVFDGRTNVLIRSFYANAGTTAGARVAVGDMNADGFAEIVTASGSGAAPFVRVFSGATGQQTGGFNAFATTWRGGVNIAAGDVNGDGRADIVAGTDAGGPGNVRVFSGTNLAQIASFVSDATFTGGVRVAARDVNGDGTADIITAQGRGGRNVRLHSFAGNVLASYLTGDTNSAGGVFVG